MNGRIFFACAFGGIAVASSDGATLNPLNKQRVVSESGIRASQGPRNEPRIVPQIDSQAWRKLIAATALLRKSTALRATVQTVVTQNGAKRPTTTTNVVRYMRPNFVWREETSTLRSAPPDSIRTMVHTIGCNSTSTFESVGGGSATLPSRDERLCQVAGDELLLSPLFDADAIELLHRSKWDTTGKLMDPLVRSLKPAGRERWNGAMYDIVEWVYETAYLMPSYAFTQTARVFIDSTGYIRRMVTTNTKGTRIDRQILSLEPDAALSANDFAWAPPKGPVEPAAPTKPDSLVGRLFPGYDATVPFLDGSPTTLRKRLAGKKGALLWFWNTTCWSCMTEFPHLEQMYGALKARGIEIIAVDIMESDTTDARTYRAFHGTTMPILFSEAITLSLTDDFGGFVIVDSTGTVVRRTVYPEYLQFWRALDALAGPSVKPAREARNTRRDSHPRATS